METLKKEGKSDEALADYLYSKGSLTQEEMESLAGNAEQFWTPFLTKIFTFDVLLEVQDIFEKYCEYILRKFIKNGYQRIEFRALLVGLK